MISANHWGFFFLAVSSVPQIVIDLLLFFFQDIMDVLQEIFFSFPQTNYDPPTAGDSFFCTSYYNRPINLPLTFHF